MCLFQCLAEILARIGRLLLGDAPPRERGLINHGITPNRDTRRPYRYPPQGVRINRGGGLRGTPWAAAESKHGGPTQAARPREKLSLQFIWPDGRNGAATWHTLSDDFERRANDVMFWTGVKEGALRSPGNRSGGRRCGACSTFNDLPEFLRLNKDERCAEVKIRHVLCHTWLGELQGIGIGYQSLGEDGGVIRETKGPYHNFGPITYDHGMDWGHTHHELDHHVLDLERDEYLIGLRFHKNHGDPAIAQGGCSNGVSFVTTKRTVLFGTDEGGEVQNDLDMMVPHPSDRIVAFAWSAYARSAATEGCNLGFYAESKRWLYLGPLVMLRWLVQNGRASFVPESHSSCTTNQLALQALLESPDDVWRCVVSFL
mmetsp:Transcript_10888/g.32240  ORF Transcript_10888/g.32240 Transcript_10888/m.32240 type:complete len:372 (-) Transcript_10888:289-1404(-)